MITGDRIRVSVRVDLPLEETFRVFTEEIDLWWRRGYRFRASGPGRGVLHLEPCVGGRLFETYEEDGEHRVASIGTVTVWQPPRHIEIAWRNLNFGPGEITHLSVGFESTSRGTLVTVTHEGWASLRPDHPSRHGLAAGPFLSMTGRWWGDLLGGLREHASERGHRADAACGPMDKEVARASSPSRSMAGRGMAD